MQLSHIGSLICSHTHSCIVLTVFLLNRSIFTAHISTSIEEALDLRIKTCLSFTQPYYQVIMFKTRKPLQSAVTSGAGKELVYFLTKPLTHFLLSQVRKAP